MTPIDWNNSNSNSMSRSPGGPWGRFGEPEHSYSPRDDSLKLPRRPRRKGSFDDVDYDDFGGDSEHSVSKSRSRSSHAEDMSPTVPPSHRDRSMRPPTRPTRKGSIEHKTKAADDQEESNRGLTPQEIARIHNNAMLSSSSHHERNTRQHRRSWRLRTPMDFEIPSLESCNSDDHLLYKQKINTNTHQHTTHPIEDESMPTRRRASAGAKFFETAEASTPNLDFDEPPTVRRVSISGPRPCMESTAGTFQEDSFQPARRRSSFGHQEAAMDRPILRPYRQLSSENLALDMCIGEETDEDLSNRSMLRSADVSNRSNRSAAITDFSNRSNRSAIPDFSNRSNRSGLPVDFSNRSNRSVLIADFSNRSNRSSVLPDYNSNRGSSRSCFRTVNDFSTRSRATVAAAEYLGVTAAAAEYLAEAQPIIPSSPVVEDTEHSESDCSPVPIAPDAADESPTQEPQNASSGPESWPVKPKSIDDDERPSLAKSKTWPTNLMILLSIKRLSLRNLHGSDSDEENESFDCDFVYQDEKQEEARRTGQSHSPYRKNNLLRTIHTTNGVTE